MHQVPPRNPQYSAADLWPPGSKGNVEFPPAAFHPVYLGNFMCQQPGELVPRVQQYFASKGLLARMVFVRDGANDPFRAFQNRNKMYDCLVYFTRQQDAEDAVTYLHREKYFGHRLNIFPGRERCYFEPGKMVRLAKLPNVSFDAPVQIIEDEVRKIVGLPTMCSVRHIPQQVLVEFQKPQDAQLAIRLGRRKGLAFGTPQTAVPKQRFIEHDVEQAIAMKEPWKVFPIKNIRDALFQGRILPLKGKKLRSKPVMAHRPFPPAAKYRQQTPSQTQYVIAAMQRIKQTAEQRQLDINLYRSMFPNAYRQFMAMLQASLGDTRAGQFLATHRPPWQTVNRPLTEWESSHVQLHNVGLEHIQSVIEKRQK